ncbi:MAG: hypothetical protein HYV09_11070 [Deltaproteobacteria bacterium]|nr:hypothetical protein [Deltaproteobacteria bacterium]
MRVLGRGALLVTIALVACKGDRRDDERDAPKKPQAQAAPKATAQSAPEVDSATPTKAGAEPAGPRYLRPNSKGVLVDAFDFPSVPASIVEQEVAAASSRSDAVAVLRRFGLAAPGGSNGHVWIGKASLVDRLGRERVLVASFRGEPGSDGLRDDDGWIAFLGSTSNEERVLKIGAVRVKAKTVDAAPVDVDARELHSKDADDVVATWSSCVRPMQKACHTLRAWTMQRGYPEPIVDVTADNKPTITGAAPPHEIVVDDRVLKWDGQAFAYR